MKKRLPIISMLIILTLSVTGVAALVTIPNVPNSTPDWELAWVKLLDRESYASMTLIKLLSEGEMGTLRESPYAVVISELPQIITVRISDGEILNSSSSFMPPSFGTPVGAELYTDRSGNGRFTVNLEKTGTTSYVIYVYDILKNSFETIPLEYRRNPLPVSIKMTYTGEYILVGDQRGYLACYKATDSNYIRHTPFYFISKTDPPEVYISAASDDNKAYLISRDATHIWNYTMTDDVLATDISTNGEYIVFGGESNKVYYFKKSTSTPQWSFTTPDDILDLDMTPDGNSVVAALDKASGKPTLLFWANATLKTGTVNPSWNYTMTSRVESVSISDDGNKIAAGCKDNKIYLFSSIGTLLWSYTTGGDTNIVRLSANGDYLAAGSNDDKVYYFNTSSNVPLWSYDTGHNVIALAVSGTGDYVAAGSYYPRIHFFDGPTGKQLWAALYPSGYPRKVRDLDMSYDGRYLVAGSSGGWVFYFDTRSSSPLWSYTGKGWISPVRISPDGRVVVAGSEYSALEDWKWHGKAGGSVLIWDRANDLQGEDQGPTRIFKTNGDINDVAVSFPTSPSITVRLAGLPSLVMDSDSRLLYVDALNNIYTAPILYVNSSRYNFWRVDSKTDSGTIFQNATVTLNFASPENSLIPLQPSDYDVYALIQGYTYDGYPYRQRVYSGTYAKLMSVLYVPPSGGLLGSSTTVSGNYQNLAGLDGSYWQIGSYGTSSTTGLFNPQSVTLQNSTRDVSGSASDLSSNDGIQYKIVAGSFSSNFSIGTGVDGALVVTSGQTVYTDSVRTMVSTTSTAGQNNLMVSSTTGFSAGDEVLVIQMLGTGLGNWETKKVASIASGKLVLTENLERTYTKSTSSYAQVIRVPQYTDVTTQNGGILTAHDWSSSSYTGGVVFFRANGTVTVELGGKITATGIGFSGGAGDTTSNGRGDTGEGLGGGQGGASPGSRGSLGSAGGGGGGGGHGTAGLSGETGGGSSSSAGGAGGVSYGSASATSLTIGSGGGGGGFGYPYGSGTQSGSRGGDGGGIVVISAKTITIDGEISANGENGVNGGGWGAGGGGGAGGTTYLTAASFSGLSNVAASGSSGGSGGTYGGSGGNGGNGYMKSTQGIGKYTSIVEFAGTSNTETMTQLEWNVDSAWTIGGVGVKIQLWNYALGRYATSGENGYLSYTSSSVAGIDETKTGTISTNPNDFKDSSGNWKVRITGEKQGIDQFNFKCDWIAFNSTWNTKQIIDWQSQFTIQEAESKVRRLDFSYYGYYTGSNVNQTLYLWNWDTSAWVEMGLQSYPTANVGKSQTFMVRTDVGKYIDASGNIKVRIQGERIGSSILQCGADYLSLTVGST